MSSSGMQISVVNHRRESPDSKMTKFDNDFRENLNFSWRKNLNEYLYNSTLHGLRYVGDRNISRWERLFFACMFLLVIMLSVYFISTIWIKWSDSPIIVTLSSKTRSIKDLPFPAITICNMNQVKKSAVENISKDSPEFSVVKGRCSIDSNDNDSNSDSITWPLYRKVLLDVSPTCESMLLYCEYGRVKFNCTTKFRTVLTDDGMCCTFNAAHRKHLMKTVPSEELDDDDKYFSLRANKWTPESGFGSEGLKLNGESSPLPGVGTGNEMGLSLVLNADIHDYYCSSTKSYGFKVLLHSPNDQPRVAHYGLAIPNGFESRIVIVPTISEASYPIRKIAKNIRQCIFENENFLDFYRIYSIRNCESECETKILYMHCNCIMYYMPRFHPNLTICGYKELECVQRVDLELQLKRNSTYKCSRCLTGCFALSYESTYSTAKIFERDSFLLKNKLDPKNVAVFHTYYATSDFRSQKKEELVGFADFLSNMGGLLGLFMGFSVISVIEMFYFISIRPYFSYLRFTHRKRMVVSNVVRRMENLRLRRNSPILIRTVQSSMHNETAFLN